MRRFARLLNGIVRCPCGAETHRDRIEDKRRGGGRQWGRCPSCHEEAIVPKR